MPQRAKRLCSSPGCTTLVATGKCPRHAARAALREQQRKADLDARRPKSGERGYDADWRAVRRQFLAAHPACVGYGSLEGRCPAPATEADHIVSVRDAPELRLKWSNLRAYCKGCHSRRTATEQGFAGMDKRHAMAHQGQARNPAESGRVSAWTHPTGGRGPPKVPPP